MNSENHNNADEVSNHPFTVSQTQRTRFESRLTLYREKLTQTMLRRTSDCARTKAVEDDQSTSGVEYSEYSVQKDKMTPMVLIIDSKETGSPKHRDLTQLPLKRSLPSSSGVDEMEDQEMERSVKRYYATPNIDFFSSVL